jgi:shikimate kinase
MKVVIIGFMGSGKSTVGAILARRAGLPFYDMDELVVQRSGHPSVRECFEALGEVAFRQLETLVAEELALEGTCVISTGGGVVTTPATMEALRSHSTRLVYLSVPFEVAQQRVGEGDDRPLFREVDAAASLYESRLPLYTKWADFTVDGTLDPFSCAEEVLRVVTGGGVNGAT